MSINSSWYIQDRVILTLMKDKLLAEEMKASVDPVSSMIRSSDKVVHHIVDTREISNIISTLPSIGGAIPERDTNLGWTLVVTNNSVVKMLVYIVTQFNQGPMKFFSTLEEAVSFLQSADETLPPMS